MREAVQHPWFLAAALAALGLLALAACAGGEGIGTRFQAMGADHIPDGQEYPSYNSNPPTSGPHWGTWARCGVYPRGLPNGQVVHNLEHGNVVISHSLRDTAEVERLTGLVERLPRWKEWGVLRFYADMPEGQVAMAAWSVLDTMSGVDEERIKRFWDAYAPNRLSGEARTAGAIPCNR